MKVLALIEKRTRPSPLLTEGMTALETTLWLVLPLSFRASEQEF